MDTKSLCLGVLSMGDASGYEIWKQFEEGPFSHFFDAGFGSIYPALNRLLEDGLVTCVSEPQAGRPTKKTYSITDAGRDAFLAALAEDPARDRIRSDSLAMMFFGHMIAPAQRAKVLDGYIAHFRGALDRLHKVDVSQVRSGRCFTRGFGIAVYEAALNYLETNRNSFLEGEEEESVAEPRTAVGGKK